MNKEVDAGGNFPPTGRIKFTNESAFAGTRGVIDAKALRRLALLASAIAVLIALIVLGSRPFTESQSTAQPNTTVTTIIDDVIVAFMMVVTVAGAALLAYLFWPKRRRKKGDDEFELYVEPIRIHWAVKVALILLPLLIIGGLILAVYRAGNDATTSEIQAPIGSTGVPSTASEKQSTTGSSGELGGTDTVAIMAATVLIVATLVLVLWAIRRHDRPIHADKPPEQASPSLAQELAAAVDESLDDLRSERDPRRAVIAAYARMERIFAQHGLPRRDVEAPYEYAGRVLRELGLGAGAVRGLTHLFELARFSHHEIRALMQEQAIAALIAIREEL